MRGRGRGRAIPVAALAGWLLLAACSRGDREPAAAVPTDRITPRVVSLSPAITRTMIDLGAGDLVVGRTPYCRGLDSTVPAVGSLLEFDPEALLAVDPDLVLVQPGAAGIQPDLAALAASEGWTIRTWRLDGLDDLERLLRELPEALSSAETAAEIGERSRARLKEFAAVCEPLPDAASPVVVLFAMEPPMAFGSGTFVGDLLDRIGVGNAVTARGYPELSAEDLVSLAPARVVLLRDGGLDAAEVRLRSMPLPTPDSGRVVVEDPDALTPGSPWIDAARRLREAVVDRGVS